MTMKIKEHEGMFHDPIGQLSTVPWWTAFGSQAVTGESCGLLKALPVQKNDFEGKRKIMKHFEDEYKSRKIQFQNYYNPSSPIANMNLQAKDPPKNFPKRNYQKTQELLPLLPLPLNEMYQKLIGIGQIAPEPQAPLQLPYPNWYKLDLICEYNAGAAGHSIHTCGAFKKRLMRLIKTGWITFEENPGPAPN